MPRIARTTSESRTAMIVFAMSSETKLTGRNTSLGVASCSSKLIFVVTELYATPRALSCVPYSASGFRLAGGTRSNIGSVSAPTGATAMRRACAQA